MTNKFWASFMFFLSGLNFCWLFAGLQYHDLGPMTIVSIGLAVLCFFSGKAHLNNLREK